ncbi:hypothetical protein [Aquimarina sp. SS2-1]|uniref:hypothetical protein n=1 Tax=Aquimarina besae TaxID=3342247 RepID=UPI003671DA5E
MKNFLLSIVFISVSLISTAQEVDITSKDNNSKKEVFAKNITVLKSCLKNSINDSDKICYGETSKVAFYEVLIAKNGFNIELKNSKDLVIKNTEEIISKKRDEVLYSEED